MDKAKLLQVHDLQKLRTTDRKAAIHDRLVSCWRCGPRELLSKQQMLILTSHDPCNRLTRLGDVLRPGTLQADMKDRI